MRTLSQNARAFLASALKRKAPPAEGGAEHLAGIKQTRDTVMLLTKERNADAASAPLFSATQKPSDLTRYRDRLAALIRTGEPQYISIEPWQAEIMLERNTSNRRARSQHIAFLAREMREGRWHITGQPIIFNADGELQDGQHRLKACLQAGVSFQTLVVFRVPREAFIATDVGLKRSGGDMLHRHGVKNWNCAAATARIVIAYDNGSGVSQPGRDYSNEEMAEWVLAHDADLQESIRVGNSLYGRGRLVGQALASASHFIFARIDRAQADDFIERVGTGVGIESVSDPIARLRSRLMDNASSRARLGQQDIAALFIKAWNAYRRGDKLGVLRWKAVGPQAEEFPVAV